MIGRILSAAAAIVLAALAIAPRAQAQGLDFADQQGAPVEVYADNGLELSQDAKTVIAHGNARAVRGKVTVTADTLIAHYRDKAGAAGTTPQGAAAGTASGGAKPAAPAATEQPKVADAKPGAKSLDETQSSSEIWRLEATGHVVIFTATQHAYGDHADYNIDDAVVVLTGKNLHMTTPTDVVTARDSLEYWEHRQQAVARGNAVATRADKRLQGDILVADYGQNDTKQTVLRHATAFDHVILTTASDVVTGNRADYDPISGIVTVNGAVKMTRGQNQLDGQYAVVNLNTGISRMFPTAPGGTESSNDRVKALLVPQRSAGTGEPAKTGSAGGGNAAATDQPPPKPTLPQ
jgi:lipopolysaccharide export system protein LptA